MMESLPLEMRRMIMEHFSNAELLTISLVNKFFKHEARSLMRSRANLSADLGVLTCQNIIPFVSHLKDMDVIPFSAIKIRWCSEDHDKLCSRPDQVLSPLALSILERVPWKRLSVSMHGGPNWFPIQCPALQLVQKILTDFSGVLEELELNIQPKLLQFIQEITQDSKFPHLKILRLEDPDYMGPYDRQGIRKSFVKEMVARAPNLREFHQNDSPDLSENLLEGSSSAVLVSNCEDFNPALREFSEGFTGTVKLKRIEMSYAGCFSMETFMRTVPRILQSSFDTLHSIKIHLVFLVPLMGFGGLCLKNVTIFTICIDYADYRWELTEPRILSLLKQFDFTRMFPKLNKVAVSPGPYCHNISACHLAEFANFAVLKEPTPDRAMNIKNLSASGSLPAAAVPLFAGMFPNIETLATTRCYRAHQVPYPFIWEHWLELKDLQVSLYTGRTSTRNENLDSDFCGIFPEEVALLREQTDEYLRDVHIVPVMPSIACLRALRSFKIVCRLYNPLRILDEEEDPIFSKVTAFIAFQRCPNLSVNIETNSQQMFQGLNHLRPCAAVQLVE